jgi:hydroxyethylthiazole kinase-like uncharacterized protein yjeF
MIPAYRAADVRAAEEPLLAAGPPGALMAHAAFALATQVIREVHAAGRRLAGTGVLALAGGGNNGGDALHAAAVLAARGAAVTAALLTPSPHAGGLAAARRAGVRVLPVADPRAGELAAAAGAASVWVDGLAGIGASGPLREPLAGAVEVLDGVRRAGPGTPTVVAVDTPSGIGVDDGTVPGPVLAADVTVTMGVAKPGLLLPPADALAGRVVVVDIGLRPGLRDVEAGAARLEPGDVAGLWPRPDRGAHKYTRGVLGVVAGSDRYPGAGVLTAWGAVATGVGMVRYLGEPGVLRVLHARLPEVVGAPGRVQAWVLGPGTDAADRAAAASLGVALRAAVDDGLPAVLDAGALALLAPGEGAPPPLTPAVVLTPHAGELAQLLGALGVARPDGRPPTRADVEAAPAAWARRTAVETGASVLLKGPTTVVAAPRGPVLAQADATPWLATAGAGDVLAGVLGALLAGRSDDVRADPSLAPRLAAAAALVHGRAARRAGGPCSAGDVARALPAEIGAVLEGGSPGAR